MIDLIFLYLGAALTSLWVVAHLFPKKSVVEGSGNISIDNKRIITMEWIVEGTALVFMGLLVATVTFVDPESPMTKSVYILTALGLVALAMVSSFTGFKIKFLPFRLCPLILFGGVI